jgi:hypothetical protein
VGAPGRIGIAALCAAILLTSVRAAASTVVEPIARLTLEGGYDSNVLYDGAEPISDRTGRVSPDLGLRLRDHTWELRTTYGVDFLTYGELQPGGTWNHRGFIALDARPSRRLMLRGTLRGAYAFDPVGLAQMGIFRTGRDSAFILHGRGRVEYRFTERIDVAGTLTEETVRFEDHTGGAMHQPGVEALYHTNRRLALGGGVVVSFFQEFEPDSTEWAHANGLRARARYELNRHFTVNASAGGARWLKSGENVIVPEGAVEILGASRHWELRAQLAHALGIGNTARPALVDSVEAGVARRFARRFDLRGDGGIWRSGRAPGGEDAVTGYTLFGEAGLLVGGGVRLALAATHFGQLEDPSPAQRRTTFGLRLGWTLSER